MILLKKKEKPKVHPNGQDISSNPESINFTDTDEKNNSIKAIYSLQKKEELFLFNPEKINLSKDKYELEVLTIKDDDSNSTSSYRNLQDIHYKFISDINGKIEIRITFFDKLT